MDLDKSLQALVDLEEMDSQGIEVVEKVILEEEVEDFEGILPPIVMVELHLVVALLDLGDRPVEEVVVEQL
jgi:hypothetical protein